MNLHYRLAASICVLGLSSSCASAGNLLPGDLRDLQIVSAGYTGCLPQDNALSNVNIIGAKGTWNASCLGKTYLCSEIDYLLKSMSYSCAPVAKQS